MKLTQQLLSRVDRLEDAERAPLFGIVWTDSEIKLPEPRPERVAEDIYIRSHDGNWARATSVERAAEGPDDLGHVYEGDPLAGAVRVGELVAVEGCRMEWRLLRPLSWQAA